MKTAVSVPDPVFEAAEALAERMGVSRSQLYTTALEAYLAASPADDVTARLDVVYGDVVHGADRADAASGVIAARALVDAGAWEW